MSSINPRNNRKLSIFEHAEAELNIHFHLNESNQSDSDSDNEDKEDSEKPSYEIPTIKVTYDDDATINNDENNSLIQSNIKSSSVILPQTIVPSTTTISENRSSSILKDTKSQQQQQQQQQQQLTPRNSKHKRFNLSSNNLMSQNVDERDEYEQSDADNELGLLEEGTNYESTSTNKRSSTNTKRTNHTDAPINEEIVSSTYESSPNKKHVPIQNGNLDKKSSKPKQEHFSKAKRDNNTTPSESQNSSGRKLSKYKKRSKGSEHKPKDVFVELFELKTIVDDDYCENYYEWREISRWIKYEQDADFETGLWSKPYVGALLYQSLLYLKTGLQYGTVLLDLDCDSLDYVIQEMTQDFVDSGHMNKEDKDDFRTVLLGTYVHHPSYSSNGAINRKKSIMSDLMQTHSRRASTFNVSSHSNEPKMFSISPQNSSNALQKSYIDINSNEDHKKLNRRDSSVKFHVHEHLSDNNNNIHAPTPLKQRRSTLAMINSLKNSVIHLASHKSEGNLKGMVDETEVCMLMVGVVDFLDRPVMAFIRLQNPQDFDDLVEVQLKVRFIFVLLGPKNPTIDYIEIGRCMGTLMTNREFHHACYKALDRRELIDSISKFINKSLCVILPVGDYDKDLLVPVIDWIKDRMNKKKKRMFYSTKARKNKKQSINVNTMYKMKATELCDEKSQISDVKDLGSEKPDPFKRRGCLFGGLIYEMKNRYSKYLSDLSDGFNMHCLMSVVFIFTVCFAPALTFGGILADKTDHWLGVNEMLIATCVNGLIFGLFSGQPLMILGSTGPFLIFEEMLFIFCKNKFCIEFLPTRFWVSAWVLIMALLMVAFQGIFIIHYVTRFAEEIFAFLIACVFLTDAIKKIFYVFKHDPIYTLNKYCTYANSQYMFDSNGTKTIDNDTNYTFRLSNNTQNTINLYSKCVLYDNPNKLKMHIATEASQSAVFHPPEPNVALLSFVLFIGTCAIALVLKKLRRSNFLGTYIRRTLSDVGILVAILTMVGFDYLIESRTGIKIAKVDIPDVLTPTKSTMRTDWFVSPLGNLSQLPLWVPFAAILPALLVFIVLFMEVELIGVMLNASHRKLQKGSGFHLDLLLSALLMTGNSLFGLPWMCAAPVRTLTHWASLTVYSSTHIPGEKPRLTMVLEQRITNICVHVAIGLCILGRNFLKTIPVCVLFGIFLYFGIVSLSGTQLFERIKLIFKPSKYRPNVAYARAVRPLKRNLFTIIQLIGVAVLLALKSYIKLSFLFPIVLVLLVPFRLFILPKIFTYKELEQLDQEEEDDIEDSDTKFDFYQLTHLPI